MPLNTCSWAARASGPRTGTDFILLLELGSHLGGEILRLLLDSFTQSEAQEARQPDRRADQLAGFLDDLAASVAWIRDQPDLAGLPIGCVGFCFGGHLALLAATLPVIGATCAFYGARVSSFRPGGGPPSLELVPQIPGRLWCFCGDQDPLIPLEEIKAVAAALTAANGGVPAESAAARHRLLLAPGAGHGYMCEARADFSAAAARCGWTAMLSLFGAMAGDVPSP